MKTGMLTIMAVLAMQAAAAQSAGDAALLRMQDAFRKNQSAAYSNTKTSAATHKVISMVFVP